MLPGVSKFKFDFRADTRNTAVWLEVLDASTDLRISSEVGKTGTKVIVHYPLKVTLVCQLLISPVNEAWGILKHCFQSRECPGFFANNLFCHCHPERFNKALNMGNGRAIAELALIIIVGMAKAIF